MDVLFFDRKNDRIVKASQLMEIKLTQMGLAIDSDEYKHGPWLGHNKHPAYLKEEVLGTLAYKSDKCPSHCNWDLYCNVSDLVFMKLESK